MRASRQDHEGFRFFPPAAGGDQKVQESRKGLRKSADLRDRHRHRVPEEDETRRRGAGGHRKEREPCADTAREGEPQPGGEE